jgi:hypothetical protein
MTREEVRASIRGEIERQGYAVVLSGELWAAFAAPGEDASVSFEDALRGFAAVNGWVVRRADSAPADAFAFYPAARVPTLFESSRDS